MILKLSCIAIALCVTITDCLVLVFPSLLRVRVQTQAPGFPMPNLASPVTIHSRARKFLEPMAPLKEIKYFEQSNYYFTLLHEKEAFFILWDTENR